MKKNKALLYMLLFFVFMFLFNLNVKANMCSANATSKVACEQCEGYAWDTSSNKCVQKVSLEGGTSGSTSEETKEEDSDIINGQKYDNYSSGTTSCGDGLIQNIPTIVPSLVSSAYTTIQILVPVVLVIIGSIDLFKGITAQKEEDIKKGQTIFIKRLISGVLIFFVFVIVKLLVSAVADNSTGLLDCAECFINNDCGSD